MKSGLYRYIFSEFDTVDKIVKESTRVGFAVPLQSDNFRVVRFDLKGANRAIELLESVAEKAFENTTPKEPTGTKDQSL
jgi:hypothetical protein